MGHMANKFVNCKWIWLDDQKCTNQYVEFRQSFNISEISELTAYISVDSDYEFWLNGNFIGSNQYPNWPNEKTYNSHKITSYVHHGENIICIRVYYRGENFSTYAKGNPGLIFSLINSNGRFLVGSNRKWKCRLSPTYKSGLMPKVTVQLSYTIEYDASKDDGWELVAYDDCLWRQTVEVAYDKYCEKLEPRPIKPLLVSKPLRSIIVQSGFINYANPLEKIEFSMYAGTLERNDFHLSDSSNIINNSNVKVEKAKKLQGNKGIYLIYDLGSEQTGLLDIVLTATAGTIINIGHGEHLDDNRVRAHIGGRNFIDRYITKEGKQHWVQNFRRIGCRFIQLNIPEIFGNIEIERVTLRPVYYPFDQVDIPNSNIDAYKDIWDISVQTLRLCAHEHYEDCPWREQSLYAFDARLQALYGYHAFKEYEFSAQSLNLLSKGLRRDGLLELCAPSQIPINIPSFSLHWIIAVRELLEYSGQKKLVAHHSPVIKAILDAALSRLTNDNIVVNSTESEYWHFYEWSDGLSGDLESNLNGKTSLPRFDACYNLLLIDALRSVHVIDRQLSSYRDFAKQISNSFHDFFWDKNRKLYASFVNPDGKKYHFAQLTQALAIMQGIVHDSQIDELCSKIINDKTLVRGSLSSLYFIYESLLSTDLKYLGFVFRDIKEKFGSMIKHGATSLWETTEGSSAFDNAGSLPWLEFDICLYCW